MQSRHAGTQSYHVREVPGGRIRPTFRETNRQPGRLMRLALALIGLTLPAVIPAQPRPLRVFISVDMEGIGGIGTAAMTSSTGKDYATGRELMTAEVNAVVDHDYGVAAAVEAGKSRIDAQQVQADQSIGSHWPPVFKAFDSQPAA